MAASTAPPRRLIFSPLSLVALALLACAALADTVTASALTHSAADLHRNLARKLTPAKRDYHSHRYYVLELDLDHPSFVFSAPGDAPLTPEDVAELLGAEHVEQVGELKGHYLVRAALEDVEKGDEAWAARQLTAQAVEGSSGTGLQRRSEVEGKEEKKRDKVLERYDLLRRRDAPVDALSKRNLGAADVRRLIRSLEPQVPRQRIKRDLPVLAPDETLLQRLARRGYLPLGERQGAGKTGALPGLIGMMKDRFSIMDPLWPKQWHLVNEVMQENSINVTGVWDQGIVGQGVNVAIVDDGLDMHSDDLAANFHPEGSWDYNDNTPLPEPRLSDDQHGTRCAGEIAAVKNDVCGVGVAHGAGIAGIRILSASISDADEASSLNYGYQTNDIYSCSWGPPDDGRSMEAPGRLIVKAMLNGVQNGRDGKGSIFVFASGNGGSVDDQCNFDGYTNSLMSITVGAIDRKGLHPFYSEACSANMVVTFSSGSGDNIHTTDVGKNTCTDRHGGTSAAAPIAAGIFALVLEARPELTWRDMQHLCVNTAVQVNPNDPDWQLTSAGRPYNHKYGYGKLDAWAIVDLAKRWELVKPQAWFSPPEASPVHSKAQQAAGVGVPVTKDGATAGVTITQADLDKANFDRLEHVTITVWIEHERRGNLEVELDSPNGVKSVLARPRRFDDDVNGMMGWVFMSVKHWDENPIGTWTLRVRDRQTPTRKGVFHKFALQLWGSSVDASLAKPYVLPFVYDDDPDVAEPLPVETTTAAAPVADETKTETDPLAPTKTYVKPTAHLPDDHAEQTGEAHSSFADGYHPSTLPTPSAVIPADDLDIDEGLKEEIDYSVPGSSTSTPIAGGGNSLYDQTPGYLAGLSSLVGSTTWLFVALGTIVVFIAGTGAFFLLRRRRSRSSGGGAGGRGGYAFAPATDFEDYDEDEDQDLLPMSAMERGRVRLAGGEGERGGRTRELFNAFALDSDDDEEEDDGENPGPRRSVQRKRAEIELQEGPFRDEMDDLSDDDLPATTGPHGSNPAAARSSEPLTLADQERRAREEFSD
ncbi:hypothetical protein JCM8097_006052 [Rhodosporidiobolus ruineniae]